MDTNEIKNLIENQVYNTLTLSPLTRQEINDILENIKSRLDKLSNPTPK